MDATLESLIAQFKNDTVYPCEIKKHYSADGKLEKILIEVNALVTHKSPPKGYPSDKGQYADPANYKYPIDSKSRVLAAWRYINQSKNQKGYSSSQVAAIKARIKSAAKKYGLDLQEGE